jgi:hypothetical protein
MTTPRVIRCSVVGVERKMRKRSPKVMQPKFSMAPGYPGVATWSYLGRG